MARVLAILLWLLTPVNFLATSGAVVGGYGIGWVKGYHVASKTVRSRVELAVKRVETDLKFKQDVLISDAGTAADAVQTPQATPGPRGRDALHRLCHGDPACRRDGS